MSKRPKIGSLLAVGGALFLLLAGLLSVANPAIFLGSVVSGLLNLAFGVMLYRKPGQHSLWSASIIAVSIFDALGAVYFFYSPSPQASTFTMIAAIGPLVCFIGGIAGILWKGAVRVPSVGSKPPVG